MASAQKEITGLLNKFGAQVSAETKNVIKTKPLTVYGVVNASGQLANSVRYDIKENVLRVYALDYIYYLEKGRKPGKRPPTKVIEQWITDKGLILEGISKKSLAFLIARKIGEEGTTAFKQGGTQLLEDILSPELKGQIQSELILTFGEKVRSMMRSAITGK